MQLWKDQTFLHVHVKRSTSNLILVEECLIDISDDVQQWVAHAKQALHKTRHRAVCRRRCSPRDAVT